MTKNKNLMTGIFAILVVMALMGNATAMGFGEPKVTFEGEHLPFGEKKEFNKDVEIGIDMRETHRTFKLQECYGKYYNHNAFTINFNNTTAVDFANYTDYDIPDIVDGNEIVFEYPASGTIKFIPKKITGDRPQLIITIERADNNTSGMDVTISLLVFRMFLSDIVEIDHTVNVTAELTQTTIVIHIEHFSTQTLTAEGIAVPPDTSLILAMGLLVTSGILYVIYAIIHYKYRELLKTEKVEKTKKVIFWIATIILLLGVVVLAYPIYL